MFGSWFELCAHRPVGRGLEVNCRAWDKSLLVVEQCRAGCAASALSGFIPKQEMQCVCTHYECYLGSLLRRPDPSVSASWDCMHSQVEICFQAAYAEASPGHQMQPRAAVCYNTV